MGSHDSYGRRDILKRAAIGTGIAAGLAGCQGTDDADNSGDTTTEDNPGGDSDSQGDNDSSVAWPPAGNRMDIGSYVSAGSYGYTFAQGTANNISKHIQDGDQLKVTMQALEGAGGLTAANYTWNAEPDGSFMNVINVSGLLNNALFQEERAQYDPLEFGYPGQVRTYTRCIAVNHRTTNVENHWDWDWETFIDNAYDLKYALLGVGHGSHLLISLIGELHPDLDLDRLSDQFLHYGGGGEARAAIERGEADVYMGSFSGQYYNDEFYKTQFVVTDERNEGFNNSMYNVDEDAVHLGETDFPQEDYQAIVDLILDRHMYHTPPGLDDGVYDILVDGLEGLFEDEAFHDELRQVTDNLDLFFDPATEIEPLIESAWNTRLNNRDLLEKVLG